MLKADGTPVAHIGERTVEVPLGAEVLRLWNCFPTWEANRRRDDVVEVGAVMAYWRERYIPKWLTHRTIDPFDSWEECERMDGGLVDYRGLKVLSISTLEHFGKAEYGNGDLRTGKAVACLRKIMAEASEYFITIPLGYHLELDAYLQSLTRVRMLKQVSVDNTWEELPQPDWSLKYGQPFPYANGVVVLMQLPGWGVKR